jgi:alkaline phosphatase D
MRIHPSLFFSLLSALILLSAQTSRASVVRNGDHYLEWIGEGEFKGMAATAWLPDPAHVTRGFVLRPCHGRPPGSDNRDWARAPLTSIEGIPGEGAMTKRLAARYGFGVIGLAHFPGDEHWQEGGDAGRSKQGRSTRAIMHMLEEFATLGLPEFVNAPLLSFGGSHAGVASWSLACAIPDRMLAVAPNDPMACLPAIMPRPAFEVPVFISQGPLANGQDDNEERSLRESRLHGARTAYANIEAMGHEDGPTFDLVFPFLEAAIRLRLSAEANPQLGPVTLRPIPLEQGWLADGDFRAGLITIAPYATYPGDRATAFWLPEKSLAHTYRGLASYGSPHVLRASVGDGRRLGMTRPHSLMEPDRPVANDAKAFDALARPGQTLELTVEEKRGSPEPVTDWTRIEFFRDGESLGAVTSGAPTLRVALADSGRLFQTFTALVTHTDGTVRATRFGATLAVESENPAPLLPPIPRAPLVTAAPLHFANGLKIGEVGVTQAIVWTRLTAVPDMIANGRTFATDARNASAHDQLAGHPLDEFTGAVPGSPGEVRLVYWPNREESGAQRTAWVPVTAARDFTHQFELRSLRAALRYHVRVEARSGPGHPVTAHLTGSFKTLPRPTNPAPVTFAVTTCQDYPRRDDPANGHRIYASLLALKPDFLIHTGDIEYYDKAMPWATRLDLARYKWNRLYALPFQREFHRFVPTYFMKDDHDTLKDDCWPGQTYGELTWAQGLATFREQVPMGEKTYRTIRVGRDAQLWLLEGRDYRTANDQPDGPGKTILGAEQMKWLRETIVASDATFKFVVSPTPIVGPDRSGKNDSYANRGFTHEGNQLRAFLAAQKNLVVLCGDRHWQYHSVDPVTGLQEFDCGPASVAHAGGFGESDRTPAHRFLSITAGFLTVTVDRPGDRPRTVIRHHDVAGKVVYEFTLPPATR